MDLDRKDCKFRSRGHTKLRPTLSKKHKTNGTLKDLCTFYKPATWNPEGEVNGHPLTSKGLFMDTVSMVKRLTNELAKTTSKMKEKTHRKDCFPIHTLQGHLLSIRTSSPHHPPQNRPVGYDVTRATGPRMEGSECRTRRTSAMPPHHAAMSSTSGSVERRVVWRNVRP